MAILWLNKSLFKNNVTHSINVFSTIIIPSNVLNFENEASTLTLYFDLF
jgi:hypothetical protein